MASVPGVPIVRNDFFVLYGDYNRYVLQFQVGSVRFEENGHIVATLFSVRLSQIFKERGSSLLKSSGGDRNFIWRGGIWRVC